MSEKCCPDIILRRSFLVPIIIFLIVFLTHAFFSTHWHRASESLCNVEGHGNKRIRYYFLNQDYFLGFSYALAFSFTAFALSMIRQNRKEAVMGAAGGISFIGILLALGCFLFGCCGSPMLVVYLGLFGSKALGLAKPIIAAITFISVIVGYALLMRKTKVCSDT